MDIDYKIAVKSAEIRHIYRIPMADCVIIFTIQMFRCSIISDDPHFQKVDSLKTLLYSTQ